MTGEIEGSSGCVWVVGFGVIMCLGFMLFVYGLHKVDAAREDVCRERVVKKAHAGSEFRCPKGATLEEKDDVYVCRCSAPSP